MSSYFFPSTFLATLNTSTSKPKNTGKQQSRSKKDGEGQKRPEKIDEGDEKAPQDRKAEKKTPPASQIPKKTSPKKPLVPVKEEAALKKDAKRANNCKYACLLFSTIPYNGQV